MPRTLSMESYLLADAESVVARARQGDETALEALYRAFEVPVYNLARRICRTKEDAEDVLQETFFEVCRSIGRYREEGSLWGWIRTIAASKALMRLRRNKYRDTDELHDELVGRRHDETHLRMDLEAALERLRSHTESYSFPQVGHITVSIGFTQVRAGDTPNGAFERDHDHGTRTHELLDLRIERLVRHMRVVLTQQGRRESRHFAPHDRKASGLESAQHRPDQALLHAIRLKDNERFLHMNRSK